MARMSNKRRLEWSFFLNDRSRITYNELCRKCQHECKPVSYTHLDVYKRQASLAIGGILFMVGATFISSWNPDSFARMGNLEDGEYYITINHNTLVNPKPYGISEYQVNTPF